MRGADTQQIKRVARWGVALSVAAFLLSLCLPGFYTTDFNSQEAPHVYGGGGGWVILLMGWLGPLDGLFSWYANPLLWLAWAAALVGPKRSFAWGALILSVLALTLGLEFLCHSKIMLNEAGTYGPITSRGAGYWSWIVSMAVMLASSVSVLCLLRPTTVSSAPPPPPTPSV